MIIACVTGGVATGKSSLMSLLLDGDPSVAAFDCDAAVHKILAEPEWAERVAEDFGRGVLDAAGGVDRVKLRPLVFGQPDCRRRLEALIHPEVRHRCRVSVDTASLEGKVKMFFIEVPLLYESGFDVARDYEIVLAASPTTQRDRLRHQRGLDDVVAERILASQLPILEKVRRAHLVIWNEGSIPCLKRQALCLKRHPWLSP
jgi:dephospho-CoA kinase